MKRLFALTLGALLASPAMAQEFSDAQGGVIRWLDKLTGDTGDVDMARGQAVTNGRLTIQLDNCRYPTNNPAAEAEAFLTIVDSSKQEAIFSGWMLASSPAVSALQHPRFDVWVIRCMVEGYKPPVAVEEPPTSDNSTEEFGE